MSTRLWLASVAGLFVGQHDPPDVIGDPALEAAQGFAGGLALCELASEVVVAGAAWAASLDERNDVQGVVELPVTGAGQPVSGVLAAGDFEWSGAGVAGEVRRVATGRRYGCCWRPATAPARPK
jgi:hypothetical protein